MNDLKKADPKIFQIIKKEKERQNRTLNLIASENYPSPDVRAPLNSIMLAKIDPKIFHLIGKELERQKTTLNLIASENYPSPDVRAPLESIFIGKYSEGRPDKRYYGGTKVVDELEKLVEERVRKVFKISKEKWAVNVQPYSGSIANYAVLRGLLEKGDKLMSLTLQHGGHLSQGAPVSLSGKDFQIVNYNLDKETGMLDYDKIMELAKAEKPKLIIAGYSAYPRRIDFKKFREIADTCGAFLMADIAHIAGLVAGGVHPSPFPYADVVTTTTQKSLRGPRSAIIICREDLRSKIFPKVFPGMQGGPHNHTICSVGVMLKEALSVDFKKYAKQVVKNAQVMAEILLKNGFELVSGGTDNHLVLVDLTNKGLSGGEAQVILEASGIVANKNAVPYDTRPPMDPSGIRFGTPALTTRGLKEKEIKKVAEWISRIIADKKPSVKIRKEVGKMGKRFPIR